MILTGSQIQKEVCKGRITLDPFDERQLNPNSYNYRLGHLIKIAPDGVLDPLELSNWNSVELPDTGMVFEPGRLYLAHTAELIGSKHFVTSLIGRSSVGRLGLFLQVSADLANIGAEHRWTLELTVVQPLRLYPNMEIGQVSFWVPRGEFLIYQGLYGNQSDPTEYQRPLDTEW